MKILVVKLSSLGDLVQALPTVHVLKQQLQAEVHWAAQTEYVPFVRTFSDVDRAIAFPRKNVTRRAHGFLRDLRRDRYELVVDLQGLLKSALVTRLARANRRIGPSFHREGSRLFYDEVAGLRNVARHAVDQIMDTARHLALDTSEYVFPIDAPRVKPDGPSPHLALCPLSRWRSKNWPVENIARLAAMLSERTNGTIHLVGGPGDRDKCAQICEAVSGQVVNHAGQTSLVELTGLLAAVDLLVTNDSGPMHVAAAVGTPVLALFGPTDPGRTGPWGEQHRIVCADEPCMPCFKRKCRRMACMHAIGVERVVREALDMVGGIEVISPSVRR